MRAQSLAGLYLAGATLAMVSLALPRAAQVNAAAIAALAGVAHVVSAYVLARFDRLTIAEIDACVVGGALLIAGAVYFTHAEDSPYALFFVWTSLYGAVATPPPSLFDRRTGYGAGVRAVESLISAAVVADIPYMWYLGS